MNPNISIPPTAADAYRAMLAEQTYTSLEEDHFDEAPVLIEGNMTLSLSGSDKANKFMVYCKLQYEKYEDILIDTVPVTFKNRQAAEKFAKMAGSIVQNPGSIRGASPKNVFASAEDAADAIEKAGGKRPKIVKAH